MIAALRSELITLTGRRSMIGTCLTTVAIAVLGTTVPYLTDGSGGSGGSGGPLANAEAGSGGLDALAVAGGAVQGVMDVSKLLGAVVLVLAALAVTNEYTYGTLKNLLVRHPARPSLLGGKLTAIALNAAALALAALVAGLVTSFVVGPLNGVDVSAWTSWTGWGDATSALGGLVASNLTYACIGAVLGVLLRSPALAVGVGIGWTLLGEQLVGTLTSFSDWLLGQLAVALGSGSPDMGVIGALVALGVWIVCLVTVATLVFTFRDLDG